jgi:hypothetical protein
MTEAETVRFSHHADQASHMAYAAHWSAESREFLIARAIESLEKAAEIAGYTLVKEEKK